jgi:hypothetical protein
MLALAATIDVDQFLRLTSVVEQWSDIGRTVAGQYLDRSGQ